MCVWVRNFYPFLSHFAPIFEVTFRDGQTSFWLKVSWRADLVKVTGLKEISGGGRTYEQAWASSRSPPSPQLGPWPPCNLAGNLEADTGLPEKWLRHRLFSSNVPRSFLDLQPWPSPIPGAGTCSTCSLNPFCDWQEMSPEMTNSISSLGTAFHRHHESLCMGFLEICIGCCHISSHWGNVVRYVE